MTAASTGFDHRSEAAREYRKNYHTSQWRAFRKRQLSEEPLCRMCFARGVVTPATVCDHVVPHRGDEVKFWNGPFQSLCAPCHDSAKAIEESRGYAPGVGADGYPLDTRHPFNQ